PKEKRSATQPVRKRVQKPIEDPYIQTYTEPAYESSYKQEKYVPTEKPASLLAEYRRLALEDDNEVAKKAKRLRNEKRGSIKRLEMTVPKDLVDTRAEALVHFDLEQAIKIKAILDRPYQ